MTQTRMKIIEKTLQDVSAIEDKYLSDAECNLLKALQASSEAITVIRCSNAAVVETIKSREIELSEAKSIALNSQKQCGELTEKLKDSECAYSTYRFQVDSWIQREDASISNITDRLAVLGEALRLKDEKLQVIFL